MISHMSPPINLPCFLWLEVGATTYIYEQQGPTSQRDLSPDLDFRPVVLDLADFTKQLS